MLGAPLSPHPSSGGLAMVPSRGVLVPFRKRSCFLFARSVGCSGVTSTPSCCGCQLPLIHPLPLSSLSPPHLFFPSAAVSISVPPACWIGFIASGMANNLLSFNPLFLFLPLLPPPPNPIWCWRMLLGPKASLAETWALGPPVKIIAFIGRALPSMHPDSLLNSANGLREAYWLPLA